MVSVNDDVCGTEKETHKDTSDAYVGSNVFQRAKDYLGLYPYLIMSNSSFFVNYNHRRKFMQLILNDLSL